MELRYRVYLTNDGKAFGKGPYDLLLAVASHGSLNKAAQSLNMAYSKAWKMIRTAEGRLGFALLHREAGGSGGGGSYLTPEGQEFMEKYKAFLSDVDVELPRLFRKHFG